MSASTMPLELTEAHSIERKENDYGPRVRMALAGAVLLLHVTTLIITPSQMIVLLSLQNTGLYIRYVSPLLNKVGLKSSNGWFKWCVTIMCNGSCLIE